VKRPNFIVVVDVQGTEVGFTCESFHTNFDGTCTYFASGIPTTVPAAKILRFEYNATGRTWCPHCDQPVEHISFG